MSTTKLRLQPYAKAKRKLDTLDRYATVRIAIIVNENGAEMKRTKADAEITGDEKSKKISEGKSLETQNAEKQIQGIPAISKGAGKPLPGAVTPAAEPTRISIKFTDNKIDFKALGPENARDVKVYLKNSVADPAIREWAGISAASAAPDGLNLKIPPPVAGAMLDIVPFAAGMALCKSSGLQLRQVYPLVKFTEADHGMLDAQAALLMEKYMPDSWKQYSDVGIFCLTLITVMKMKTAAVEELAKKELEKIGTAKEPTFISQPAAPTPAIAPVPKGLVVPITPLPPPSPSNDKAASDRSLE